MCSLISYHNCLSLLVNPVHLACYCCPAIMDDKECNAIFLKAAGWLSKAMEQLSCIAPSEATSAECEKLVKDKLVLLLNELFHLAFSKRKLKSYSR